MRSEAVAVFEFCKGTKSDTSTLSYVLMFCPNDMWLQFSLDRFSKRVVKCFLNDLYICFWNNQLMLSNNVDFLICYTTCSLNFLNNALIVLFGWKPLGHEILTETFFLLLSHSAPISEIPIPGKSFPPTNTSFSTLSESADQPSTALLFNTNAPF